MPFVSENAPHFHNWRNALEAKIEEHLEGETVKQDPASCAPNGKLIPPNHQEPVLPQNPTFSTELQRGNLTVN